MSGIQTTTGIYDNSKSVKFEIATNKAKRGYKWLPIIFVMKKIFFYFNFLIFIGCVSCGDNYKKEFSKQSTADVAIYSVLNSLLNDSNQLKTKNISLKLEMPFIFFNISDSIEIMTSNIFTFKDLEHINSQKIEYLSFEIDSSKISNKSLLFRDFENDTSAKKYFSISRPVFNENNDICIIRKSYYCGAFCSRSGLYIYKNSSKGWHLYKIISETNS